MVANDAVPLLPLTNSKTQVTTQSDGEGGGTGSQASINYKLSPCLFRVGDVTDTCMHHILGKPMIIIAGWD
jgi:hypothetical protein